MDTETETTLIKHIRDRLQALDQEEDIAKANRDTVTLDQQSVGRLSRMDALQQQAMVKATHHRRQTERQQLLAALNRIADGSYGACEDCAEDIAAARLRLNPAVRLCFECAKG